MLEGLILQLFGHGLSVCQVESGKRLAASGEQQRLEVVRRLLEQSPENDYTLNAPRPTRGDEPQQPAQQVPCGLWLFRL